jgi:WXG100 family type VII secretion target
MRRTAGNVATELNRLMSRVRELTGSWTGQASNAFNGYYEQFDNNWSVCREALEGVSRMLDSAAEAYDEAEARIASQFRG